MLFLLIATAVVLLFLRIVEGSQSHSIWPSDVNDKATNGRITEDLRRNFDSSELFISRNAGGGTLLWNAPLNNKQKGYYRSLRGVSKNLLVMSMGLDNDTDMR